MTILVTGAKGMIGSRLVEGLLRAGYEVIGVDRKTDITATGEQDAAYRYIAADLSDKERLKAIVGENQVDRIIHLAALAHTAGEPDLTWERYEHINVECAKNVFEAAVGRPVLFISTVDVHGFVYTPVSGDTLPSPVTFYGRSKALAEEACRSICSQYSIFRLSPVYTPTVKRDIQKRYYIKYPNIAYRIGKGSEYEVLDVAKAVAEMTAWCSREAKNETVIVKDECRMKTVDVIREEKQAGRARLVLWLPAWAVRLGYTILKKILGENKYTYLLHKAVYPLRSET